MAGVQQVPLILCFNTKGLPDPSVLTRRHCVLLYAKENQARDLYHCCIHMLVGISVYIAAARAMTTQAICNGSKTPK